MGSCLHGIPYTHTHRQHVLWMGLVNISSAISICFLLGPWRCGCGAPLSRLGVAFLAGSVRLLPTCCSRFWVLFLNKYVVVLKYFSQGGAANISLCGSLKEDASAGWLPQGWLFHTLPLVGFWGGDARSAASFLRRSPRAGRAAPLPRGCLACPGQGRCTGDSCTSLV